MQTKESSSNSAINKQKTNPAALSGFALLLTFYWLQAVTEYQSVKKCEKCNSARFFILLAGPYVSSSL